MAFQVIEKTRLPSSSISSRRRQSVKPIPTRSRRVQPQIKHHRFARAVRLRHAPTRVFLRGVPLRQIGHSRPCRTIDPPSFIFSPGGAPGFSALRRFTPADGWLGHFCRPGPTCRLHAARPPRFIFVGVTDRLVGDKSKGGRPGTLFFAWRSTSGLRSHLRSASHSYSRAMGPILPWALPPAGLWALCRACDRARPRSHHQPPEHAPRVHANRASLSAHGFGRQRRRRPFSVLMGPMPCQPERLRGPSEGQLPV